MVLGGKAILEIDPERLKYCIHRVLLVHRSDYFRKALKGPWKEVEEGIITLEDVQSDPGT